MKRYNKPTIRIVTVTPTILMSMSVGNPDETVGGGFSNGIRTSKTIGGIPGMPSFPSFGNPFANPFSGFCNPFEDD